MVQRYLHIELCENYTLDFKIHNTELADLWLQRMDLRHSYPIDHPDRFYGFDDHAQEIDRSENMIQQCISTINAYQPIIKKQFTSAHDQDCLNYLHSVFEQYHGLLDQQKTTWWLDAPIAVREALANLNLAVHRCENSAKYRYKRFVCTWFGLPKEVKLSTQTMQKYGQLTPAFGSVCLNYVEIGKTLIDLTFDNDSYIGDHAFQPFQHYNPDFVVYMFELSPEYITDTLKKMKSYYEAHYDFFASQGFVNFDDVRLQPLSYPVAQLIETMPREQLFRDIQQRQLVTRVYIDETMHHTNT
jgi:hypothetical protein